MTDETDFHAAAGQGYARIGALEAAVSAHTPMITGHSIKIEELQQLIRLPLRIVRGEPVPEAVDFTKAGAIHFVSDPLETRFEELATSFNDHLLKFSEVQNERSIIHSIQGEYLKLSEEFIKLQTLYETLRWSCTEMDQRLRTIEARTNPLRHQINSFHSIEELVAAIDQIFDCKDGEYGAYAKKESPTESFRYQTLGFMTTEGENPYNRLRFEMMADLAGIAFKLAQKALSGDGKPELFWRFAKESRIQEEETKRGRGVTYKIRTRIAIPFYADWENVRGYHKEGTEYTRI